MSENTINAVSNNAVSSSEGQTSPVTLDKGATVLPTGSIGIGPQVQIYAGSGEKAPVPFSLHADIGASIVAYKKILKTDAEGKQSTGAQVTRIFRTSFMFRAYGSNASKSQGASFLGTAGPDLGGIFSPYFMGGVNFDRHEDQPVDSSPVVGGGVRFIALPVPLFVNVGAYGDPTDRDATVFCNVGVGF